MHTSGNRLRTLRPRWNQDYVDVAMAAALVACVAWEALRRPGMLPIGFALALLGTAPIAIRRRNPIAILCVTGISTTVYSVLGYPDVGAYLGTFIAFYTVAAHSPRRTVAVAALVTALGCFVTVWSYIPQGGPKLGESILNSYLAYGVAWLLGDYLRVRRLHVRELEERALRLEREREEKARYAVLEERARIARELHDVVAHHVSVMVVQAGGAKRIIDSDPAAARDALGAVEDAGRVALSEMRRMLDVLRAQQPGLAPQPGLAGLEKLIGQVRTTGLPVGLDIEGEWRELPAGIDLAGYRIVQEALTNVVKHAGPKARATVHVTFADTCLEIRVEDDGRGAVSQLRGDSGGQGLIGMRERVELYGGRLEVGPRLAGGFQVMATLPLPPARRVVHPAYSIPATGPRTIAPAAGSAATTATATGTSLGTGSDSPASARPSPSPDSVAEPGTARPGGAEPARPLGGPVFSPWPEEARP